MPSYLLSLSFDLEKNRSMSLIFHTQDLLIVSRALYLISSVVSEYLYGLYRRIDANADMFFAHFCLDLNAINTINLFSDLAIVVTSIALLPTDALPESAQIVGEVIPVAPIPAISRRMPTNRMMSDPAPPHAQLPGIVTKKAVIAV